jgi:hypothetical protein
MEKARKRGRPQKDKGIRLKKKAHTGNKQQAGNGRRLLGLD